MYGDVCTYCTDFRWDIGLLKSWNNISQYLFKRRRRKCSLAKQACLKKAIQYVQFGQTHTHTHIPFCCATKTLLEDSKKEKVVRREKKRIGLEK